MSLFAVPALVGLEGFAGEQTHHGGGFRPTCVREGGEGVQLGVAGAADPGAVEGGGFGVGV